jgi:hypothetical protein
MAFGGLRQVRDLYDETRTRHGKPPGWVMCSYFPDFADTAAEESVARPPDPLSPRMRQRRLSGRLGDGAADLPIFCRDRRSHH